MGVIFISQLGFEPSNARLRWSIARCGLDRIGTLISAKRKCNKSLHLRQKQKESSEWMARFVFDGEGGFERTARPQGG